MIDLEKITRIFKNFDSRTDDYKGAMFINIFGKLPKAYYIYFDLDNKLTYKENYLIIL